jgi:hypothetical protein
MHPDEQSLDTISNRVTRLEVTMDNHSDDIKELRQSHIDLRGSMGTIEKTLNQIKYIALGAVCVLVAQTLGLDKAVHLMLGVH